MTHHQICINQMSYNNTNGSVLFNELNLTFAKQKTGLVGRNGIGKSTLIKLILGELYPTSGAIHIAANLAYVPQHRVTPPHMTIAGLLGCEEKLNALQRITQGSVDERDFIILNEDWGVEDRIQQQLLIFGLNGISYHQEVHTLSGGEITRLLLAKAFLSNADFLLLDEPTNHLDGTARVQLYNAIEQWQGGLVVVSHDRALLNMMDEIVEITALGARCYGGHYDAFLEYDAIEKLAKNQKLEDAKKLMQKTKNSVQSSREKHDKNQTYGRELRRSGSIGKMAADAKKGRSERTQNKMLIKEDRLINQAEVQLQSAKDKIEMIEEIHVDLPETMVPNGKIILDIEDLSFSYPSANHMLIQDVSLKIQGPERIALIGDNGSGKTTLVKLILKELQLQNGKIYIGTNYVSYLDQNATLLNPSFSILENFLLLNPDANENDAYRCLAQFLFKNTFAHKLASDLSGGEKLRALLACVLMSKHPPQLLILDEPTNHLDLQSIDKIESALNNYKGAMIVISHDHQFLEHIDVTRYIHMPLRCNK